MAYSGPYGSVAGVQAYIRHMALDTANYPTTTNVETWLTERAAALTAWLSAAGYVVPVVQAEAKAVLDRFANVGAAGDAELAQRSAGYSAQDQNRRENKFLAEFATAEAWIRSGALLGLGVPQVLVGALAHQPAVGVITAGTATDTARPNQPPEWRV